MKDAFSLGSWLVMGFWIQLKFPFVLPETQLITNLWSKERHEKGYDSPYPYLETIHHTRLPATHAFAAAALHTLNLVPSSWTDLFGTVQTVPCFGTHVLSLLSIWEMSLSRIQRCTHKPRTIWEKILSRSLVVTGLSVPRQLGWCRLHWKLANWLDLCEPFLWKIQDLFLVFPSQTI